MRLASVGIWRLLFELRDLLVCLQSCLFCWDRRMVADLRNENSITVYCRCLPYSSVAEVTMFIGHCRASLLLGATLLAGLLPLVASSADKPPPPLSVCVNAHCPTQAVSAPNGIKWHPGHYTWISHSTTANQMAQIDALSSETNVQGIQLFFNWALLEGSTPGDYSNGFALIDSFLAKLGSLKVPKRLMFGVGERSFGTPPAAGTSCAEATSGLLPSYLASLSGGGCAIALPGAAGSLSVTARFWDADVMDRLIALSLAYAQRYDGNPLVEMFVGNGETSVAAPPGSGFDQATYNTQLKRWFDASEKAWSHTQLRLAANFGGSNAQMLDFMTYTSANGGVIIGGPDPELPLPNITRVIQANQIFRAAVGGGPDFRGTVPWVGEVQQLGLGTRFTQTPLELNTYEMDTMHASYMIWLQNSWVGGPAQRWSTGVLPFIQSVHGQTYAMDCPPIFKQGCNTK
jgi:hypothetical protein